MIQHIFPKGNRFPLEYFNYRDNTIASSHFEGSCWLLRDLEVAILGHEAYEVSITITEMKDKVDMRVEKDDTQSWV
jgi:hypothetical protein